MKSLLKNPFANLNQKDWIIYGCSICFIIVSVLIANEINYFRVFATFIGATALIFISKGNAWGQILMTVFCFMYAYTSYKYKYYGEVLTYLLMSLPISFVSIFEWLKNPYKKGENVVKISKLSLCSFIFMVLLTLVVTVVFYFVLKYFKTPNLLISTISVSTSFLAAYMLLKRISYYAIGYALNDIVLIILWIMACVEDISYLSVVICFAMFLINDLNGFFSWHAREKKQNEEQIS